MMDAAKVLSILGSPVILRHGIYMFPDLDPNQVDVGYQTVTLDGTFTLPQLEALVSWMRSASAAAE
jgi:hypothetical protein